MAHRTERHPRSLPPALALLSLCASMGVAAAATLSVSPVRVVIAPGRRTGSLTLSNVGRRSESFQIRAFLWKQGPHGTKLIPTTRVQFSPPMGTLAGGARQIVRLSVPRATHGLEQSYRLFIDQLPPPESIGGVTLLLRLSIPVFVESRRSSAAAVRWRVLRHQGHVWLTAFNAGGRHTVIHDLRFRGTKCIVGRVAGATFAYLLAESTRRWPVHCPDLAQQGEPSARLSLSMRTPHGTVSVPLSAPAPKR